MKVVAIIQARTSSTRLPRKVLKPIVGKPMLWHIIQRIKAAETVDEILVATTNKNGDRKIIEIAKRLGLDSLAGNEEDVLDRFYQAAKRCKADVVVRITSDDPFKDPVIIDKITQTFLQRKDKIDYVSNTIKPTYPEGLDIEVFSFVALEKAWKRATSKFDRGHVTSYIWRHPEEFRIMNVENEKGDLSNMRWTVDTREDLNFAREVYKRLYKEGEIFRTEDILDLLHKHPEISKVNEKIERRGALKKLCSASWEKK